MSKEPIKKDEPYPYIALILVILFILEEAEYLNFNETIVVIVILGTIVLLAYMLKKLINRKL